MYKKAGIIISIVLVVLAIGIFVIAWAVSGGGNDESSGGINAPAQSVSENTPASGVPQTQAKPVDTASPVVSPVQTTASTTQSQIQPIETEPTDTGSSQETGTPLTADQSIITKIDAASLPIFSDESDIGTIVGRRVYAYNGQLIFSLIINTTTHGQLEYFTTLTNYNLTDGTRLECSIRVYQAQNGNFPSIISVSSAG